MDNKQVKAEWIAQQREVCNAATPGPWESKHYGRYEDHDECCIALTDDSIEPSKYENADFIAAARTALPAALDALESSMQREAEKDATIIRLTAERDAAIMDVAYGNCATCKRSSDNCYPADVCDVCAGYQWRGVCSENAPTGAGSEGGYAE